MFPTLDCLSFIQKEVLQDSYWIVLRFNTKTISDSSILNIMKEADPLRIVADLTSKQWMSEMKHPSLHDWSCS